MFELNQENLNLIGENIGRFVKAERQQLMNGGHENRNDAETIILTGATAMPVYLTAFHAVVHNFHEVKYKNEMYEVTVAKH